MVGSGFTSRVQTGGDFVFAADFGAVKFTLATADLEGNLLHRTIMETHPERDAVRALGRAIEAGRALVAETRVAGGGDLRAVGVSSMGITREDRVTMAPNVPGWESLAIPPLLREAFGTENVSVGNDVKAAAEAEVRWGALRDVDIGIYVNLGTGFMAAPVIGGRVLHGAHGAAGEIGYNLRYLHDQTGARDGRAPLEEFVGGYAVADRVRMRFGEGWTTHRLFAEAGRNPDARAFVEEVLTEMAYHLTNLAIALDASCIAVGGGLMRSRDIILPRLRSHFERFVPFPPEVVGARYLFDAGLLGAVSLALATVERQAAAVGDGKVTAEVLAQRGRATEGGEKTKRGGDDL